MTKFQAARLRVWTLLQTIKAFFAGTSRDEPVATAKSGWKVFATIKEALLSLVRSTAGAFRTIGTGLSSPASAAFFLFVVCCATFAAWQSTAEHYEALLFVAEDEISILSGENKVHVAAVTRVIGEKAELQARLAEVEAQLAELAAAPPAKGGATVVYKKATAKPACTASCILGWSF